MHTPSPRQVRAIRAWLAISQVEFAKRAKISVSALAAYETMAYKSSAETTTAITKLVDRMKVRVEGISIVLGV